MTRAGRASEWQYELLDEHVDRSHRASRLVPTPGSTDEPPQLGVVRTRTPRVAWGLDPRWTARFALLQRLVRP